MEDAEYAVVIIGSAAGTCKAAVEEIRATTGKKVGLIKIRVFRPFPEEEIAKALAKVKSVAVMDRSEMLRRRAVRLARRCARRCIRRMATARMVQLNYFLWSWRQRYHGF